MVKTFQRCYYINSDQEFIKVTKFFSHHMSKRVNQTIQYNFEVQCPFPPFEVNNQFLKDHYICNIE